MANAMETKKTILVVDDIPDNIEVLRGILSRSYRIKVATSGAKALSIATGDDPPDLILLDIMMPGMDGYEVCAHLKAHDRTRNIPVIFVTAKDEVVDEEKGFMTGAVDYIAKPIIPRITEARVATHLALRQAMRDLERQNDILTENARLRDQVDRIMRHDLKAPLTAFIGIPSLLKTRSDLPPDVLEAVGMMEKSGRRMHEMINKSLDLFRLESGTYDLHPVPVDLLKISRQIRFELSELLIAKSAGIRFMANGAGAEEYGSFLLPGDETLCYSMLANLVKNAAEACPVGGSVTVAFDEKPIPRVSIHNPGVIPIEIRETFLQKYATHGKAGGTGLGCYSARLMAGAMGGVMKFTTDEASGTTIIIEFSGTSPRDRHQRGMDELSVLLIDSNDMVLFTIRQLLRSLGLHRILQARDAAEARAALLNNPPVQLIICDWLIPGIRGEEFIAWVRSAPNYGELPIIVMASDVRRVEEKIPTRPGIQEIVMKPLSTDIMKSRIESLLDRMKDLT
ncbi:MAG TPA: response regulator [Candidatus Ozemobacteraceae bacterium]|nr:response regulator [Candidatus Ozemobacteraceae bacterium]